MVIVPRRRLRRAWGRVRPVLRGALCLGRCGPGTPCYGRPHSRRGLRGRTSCVRLGQAINKRNDAREQGNRGEYNKERCAHRELVVRMGRDREAWKQGRARSTLYPTSLLGARLDMERDADAVFASGRTDNVSSSARRSTQHWLQEVLHDI